jgi:hypothetical protein
MALQKEWEVGMEGTVLLDGVAVLRARHRGAAWLMVDGLIIGKSLSWKEHQPQYRCKLLLAGRHVRYTITRRPHHIANNERHPLNYRPSAIAAMR